MYLFRCTQNAVNLRNRKSKSKNNLKKNSTSMKCVQIRIVMNVPFMMIVTNKEIEVKEQKSEKNVPSHHELYGV